MPRAKSTKKVDSVYIGKGGRSRKAGAPRSYHHGDLRVAVLERADEMLEEVGIENLSLRDVAAGLGVSHAAPYRHFPRKLDLLLALAERGFLSLGDAMEEAFHAGTPKERFERSGVSYVKLAVSHPVRTQLMFSKTIRCDDAPQTLQVAGTRAFQGLVNIIEDGQKSGAFTDRVDSRTLALSAWSMVHGIASLLSSGQLGETGASPGDALIREVLRQLYEGVRAE